jgi:DHA2 family multidrug resistance protein
MLYFRGFAMAFLFVPINSSILSQFTGATVGQVAGLLNLCRQIGGSIGIALIATLLATNSKQAYLDLSSKVSVLSPETVSVLNQSAVGAAGKFGNSLGFASGTDVAIRSMMYRLQTQAFMLSFLQMVWVIMAVFAIAYVPLYFLNLKKKTTAVMDAH